MLPRISGRSQAAKDLLFKLLSADPQARPTAAEALEHPWFANEKNAVIGSLTINEMFSMGARQMYQQNLSAKKFEKKFVHIFGG